MRLCGVFYLRFTLISRIDLKIIAVLGVDKTSSIYLNFELNVTAKDFSFSCRSFRKNFVSYDRLVEDAYSSMAPGPTFSFIEGPCCPSLDFIFASWIIIVNFAIRYMNKIKFKKTTQKTGPSTKGHNSYPLEFH
jgi:hypothetical protein